MRTRKNYQTLIGKLRTFAGVALFIAVSVVVCSAQNAPCGPPRTITRLENIFTDPETNYYGAANVVFNIYDDGSHQFLANVYTRDNYPPATEFTIYVNRVFLTKLEYSSGWSYTNTTSVARVGDLIEIHKNGAPYFSGRLTRPQYDSEIIEAVPHSIQTSQGELCSYMFGQIFLPDSRYPNSAHVQLLFRAQKPIIRITINEPPTQPDAPGEVVTDLEYHTYTPYPGADWIDVSAGFPNTHYVFTDRQLRYLRQGLLSYTVYFAGSPSYTFVSRHLRTYGTNRSADFEGDGQSDLSVYRPSERNWHLLLSSTNQHRVVNFGLASDRLVAGDYDADGKSDIAVYQTDNPNYGAQSAWQILKSSDNSVTTLLWGLHSDIPLTMNYDGNNVTDIVAFRPSTGVWNIRRMGDIIKPFAQWPGSDPQEYRFIKWGMAGDKPLAADFNGDGVDELAVFRPADGNWYIYNRLADNYRIVHWGMTGDKPMAEDFDGDGRADLAVYRPSEGTWYILNSLDNSVLIRQFGLADDVPVPADFDKDNVADIAVYRPSTGMWYIFRSSDETLFAARFGLAGDVPVMAQN